VKRKYVTKERKENERKEGKEEEEEKEKNHPTANQTNLRLAMLMLI